jgi:predicted dehydrogenase
MRWLLGQEATNVLCHATVLTPAKPDLGAVNLDEALRWGEQPGANNSARKGTAYDYAHVAFVLGGGAAGSLLLSHAPYLRKGLAPELELHGTLASLAVDRLANALTLARPGKPPELLETVPDPGHGNRFAKYVFPAIRQRAAGGAGEHPGLDDGWRVQVFTDAAAESARRGGWVAPSSG